MKVEQTSELIKASNRVVAMKINSQEKSGRVCYQRAFMLIRDNKFDEFTPRICPRMEEDRTCPSTPNHAMLNWRNQVSGALGKHKES
jgi:hypothetical protein